MRRAPPPIRQPLTSNPSRTIPPLLHPPLRGAGMASRRMLYPHGGTINRRTSGRVDSGKGVTCQNGDEVTL
eukprot:875229-Prorocentrum_minimum.AAC.1